MKNKNTKKGHGLCKWSFRCLAAVLVIWIVYSWIAVSGYQPIDLIKGEVSQDYAEFRGAAHIHTHFSHDSRGKIEDILSYAKDIGLEFIVISDHNNMGCWDIGKKRNGKMPLLIAANELSTDAGHLLGYNLNTKRNIFPDDHNEAVKEIHKDGGIAVIAHPARRKTQWKDIDTDGIDGSEVMNFEDFIFGSPKIKLIWMLPRVFMSQKAAFSSLIEYPSSTIKIWDELNQKKKTIGLAGTDAHGPLFLGIPAYEALLGTLNIHIVAAKRIGFHLTEDFIRESLKNGNFYMAVDCIAISRHIDFRLRRSDGTSVLIGGEASSVLPGDNLTFEASLPAGSVTNLIKDGQIIKKFSGNHFSYNVAVKGAYRVEVIIPEEYNNYGKDMIWIITNHIYIY